MKWPRCDRRRRTTGGSVSGASRRELVREIAHEPGDHLLEMGAQMSVDAASGAPVPWPDAQLGERVDER